MNTSECKNLDGYLAAWLPPHETAAFEAHLANCPACGVEIQRQRTVDRLLDAAAGQLQSPPARLLDRIEGQIQMRQRRMVGLFCTLSATAVVLVMCFVFARQYADQIPPRQAIVGQAPVEQAKEVRVEGPAIEEPVVEQSADRPDLKRPAVRVTLSRPSDAILIPIQTETPTVSIVWIHPTVKPTRSAN